MGKNYKFGWLLNGSDTLMRKESQCSRVSCFSSVSIISSFLCFGKKQIYYITFFSGVKAE